MSRTWEELLALKEQREKKDRAALKEERQRAMARQRRVRLTSGDVLKALSLTPAELTGLAKDRVRLVLREIAADPTKLALCEKALGLAPRSWEKIETSTEDTPAREAAE